MFFIGSTDNNITLLSEMDSSAAVLKEAEKILSGENFETKSFDLQVWFRRPMFWDDELSLIVKEHNSKTFEMHLLGSNGKPTSNCQLKLY